MPYPYEYSRPEVGGSGCSYANLCSYNSAYTRGVMPPTPASALGRMGELLIPSFGSTGYQTLTHGGVGPTCSGYFNVNNAYGPAGAQCGRYTTALCSGQCAGSPYHPM